MDVCRDRGRRGRAVSRVDVGDGTVPLAIDRDPDRTAIGLLLRSSGHDKFNPGILLGKDFAGETDRDLDPSLNKWWLSLYLGVAF
jgi:hypothetical protein